MSRSCHDLRELKDSIGRYDAVFFGPVFPSISKPGRLPAEDVVRSARDFLLGGDGAPGAQRAGRRPGVRRQTEILALGGVTAERVAECRAMGFDGVAVLGAVWNSADPAAALAAIHRACAEADPSPARAAERRERHPPDGVRVGGGSARHPLPWLMCLTQDGLGLSHVQQVRRLCAEGAGWVQIRMKAAGDDERRRVARECVRICRDAGAICVVNDRVDIALASGADGAHLGKHDGDWREARRALGPAAILGGTVNDEGDAARAVGAGVLDYVGVGPWRFTRTKAGLAPVLGAPGVRRLIGQLADLPAWVIGGVRAEDVPTILGLGAAGVAVSSALYAGGEIGANLAGFAGRAGPGSLREARPGAVPVPSEAPL